MAYCPNCGCIYDESEDPRCPNCGDDRESEQREIMQKEYERRQREKERN